MEAIITTNKATSNNHLFTYTAHQWQNEAEEDEEDAQKGQHSVEMK
jgi:hypothetical protein